MFISKKLSFLFLLILFHPAVVGMVYDNRYLPLLNKPNFRSTCDSSFFVRVQPFYMFSTDAYGSGGEDAHLFAGVYGGYNQADLGKALAKIGLNDPTPVWNYPGKPNAMPINRIGWLMGGHMDAGGCACEWYYRLSPHWEIGGSAVVIGSRSQLEPILEDLSSDLDRLRTPDGKPLTPGLSELMFFNSQTQTVQEDGMKGNLWSHAGIGDLDFYVRLGTLRNYFLRFKTVDAGLKLGCIIPTARGRDLNYPSAISFGGEKHWGVYVDAALDTELREDLFAGFNLRFIQRFSRTRDIRFSLNYESLNFGALKTSATIKPGLTFVFSPYCVLKELRDGFGVSFSYTLITHGKDALSSVALASRIDSKDFDVGKQLFQDFSKWSNEYITCSLIYDFAKNKECRGATPWASLDIDVPVSILAGKQSFKTYGISLRIESNLW